MSHTNQSQEQLIAKIKDNFDATDENSLFLRRVTISDNIQAPRWIVNGVIAEGVGVIAGSGGVGKTSSIVPLALAIAGFKSRDCDLEVEAPRQIVFITEDDTQINLILNGMRTKLSWTQEQWNQVKARFHIFKSKKVTHEQLLPLLKESYFFADLQDGISLPLIIFDTASANFNMQNENDNAEVSRFMSKFKEFHSDCGASVWIISHLSKASRGLSIDELINLSARGGSAWLDDAQWSAVLSSDESNNQGDRVLKVVKRRVVLDTDEIIFKSDLETLRGENRFGEMVNVDYFYTTPKFSQEMRRKQNKAGKRVENIKDSIASAFDNLEYPSKRDIICDVKGKREDVLTAFNAMVMDGHIRTEKLPPEEKRRGRSDYFVLHQWSGLI